MNPLAQMAASWKPPRIQDPARRSGLRHSFLDGLFGMSMAGLMETHAMAALLSLQATRYHLALMGSLPLFLSALVQLAAPGISARARTRKQLVLAGVWIQCGCLLLLALSGFAAPAAAPTLFVLFFAAYAMSGSFGSAAWSSWLADLIPHPVRGRFLAWRNRFFSIAQVSAGLLSGLVVQRIARGAPSWPVFTGVILAALLFRFLSSCCLRRQYEPPLAYRPATRDFSYPDFLRRAPRSNFARFAIFVGLVHGATAISGPYFSAYFLRVLELPYATFAFVVNAHLIGMLLFLPFWGRIADRHGNWCVARISAAGISLIPFPYLVVTRASGLWMLGFASGSLWSAFGLSTFNYLLDTVTPPRRVRCAAYMGATVGFCVFLGGLAGGWLSYRLPSLPFHESNYPTLFAMSGALRILAVAVFVGTGWIREIRDVHPVRPVEILAEFPGVRLSLDFVRSAYRALRRI